MNRKILMICALSISAMTLMFATFFNTTPTARADTAANARDYQVVTARVQSGEGVYLIDNRRGVLEVFTYDAQSRALRVRAIRPVADVFR